MASTKRQRTNNAIEEIVHEEELRRPVMLSLSEPDAGGRSAFTVGNADASIMNAMRRYMLARLPVIGVPFTPFAANRVTVTANTTNETDQTIWHRLGNVPVNSLDPVLVSGYAVVLDVTNRSNETRIVTTADLRLVKRSDLSEEQRGLLQKQLRDTRRANEQGDNDDDEEIMDPLLSSSSSSSMPPMDDSDDDDSVRMTPSTDDARAPVVTDVFPASRASNHFIALAELLPPSSSSSSSSSSDGFSSSKGGALSLIATFNWVPGTGAYAPCVVGYENAPDPAAIDAAWAAKEREIRETYEREQAEIDALNAASAPSSSMEPLQVYGTLEKTLANAKHDFDRTGAKQFYLPHEFMFLYEPINLAYPLNRAWRQAAKMIAHVYREIIRSVDAGTLVCLPSGTAASSGYTSVTPNAFVGGAGYDVILPNVDHSLGMPLNYALYTLCFARTQAEFAEGGSDRLNFCAFHRFTPDDKYGVIRLALVTDNSASVPVHIRTACEALVRLFEDDVANLVPEFRAR